MDSQNKEAAPVKGKMSPLIIVGIVIVVLLVGYGVMTAGKSSTTEQNQETDQIEQESLDNSANEDQSTNEAEDTLPDTSDVMAQAITVEGGSFYFKPNEIRVKKGEKVKIILNSMDAMHDFVIDEFNVKSEQIKGGSSTQVEFIPNKTGTFEFYCSVGQHRQNGMKGNLIVE